MQRPQEDDPDPQAASSVTLKYPTIPVHGTPDNWLSRSQLIKMNVNHEDSCDDTSSSLGDSSYDFIDERSNASTDYEDQDPMTESTTSSDGHGVDQIDVQFHRAPPLNQASQPSLNQGSPISNSHEFSSESGNISSNHPTLEHEALEQNVVETHHQQKTIQFEEPSVINLNSSRFTEVSHTLQILEEHDQSNVYYKTLMGHCPGHLAVTVRQSMTTHGLTPEGGSYKLLYVGPPEIREPIVQKIGTALAASLKCSTPDSEYSRPSKFNIVPISGFGEAASPEVVLIDSSGLELIVEESHYASFTRQQSGKDILHLEMADGTVVDSMYTGSRFALSSNWKLPDIAIFCVPEHDTLRLKQTRQSARSLMSRHGVQSIVITQISTWDRPSNEHIMLDFLTPHICVESRISSQGPAQTIKRSPIDLATFLNIDAGQMNRNLACLAIAHRSSRSGSRPCNEKSSTHLLDSLESYLWTFLDSYLSDSQREALKSLERYEPMAVLALFMMTLLPILVLGLSLSGFLGASKVSNSRVFPTTAVSTATLALAIPPTSGFTRIRTLTMEQSISTQFPSTSLSSGTDIASSLPDAYVLAPNKSDQFKVHVLGDCHIVLRPPHWFSKLKRPPKLSFKVLRGQIELQHQLTVLFDGVYALQISREDAYGLLNVAVQTGPKPDINECFEVDFGTSWFRVAEWKRATRTLTEFLIEDLNSAQASFGAILEHSRTGLSAFWDQQREKFKAQKEAENVIIKLRYDTAIRSKELLMAKARNLTQAFSAKVQKRNAMLLKTIKDRGERASKDINLYAYSQISTISRQALSLARTATAANVKEFAGRAVSIRRRQLREAQKKALKTWWKITGVPKRNTIEVKAKSRGRCYRCTNS